MISTTLLLAATLACQTASGTSEATSTSERLAFMKDAARAYQLRRGERGELLKLQEEPAFRLGKQYAVVLEGAIFFWVDEESRPEAAMQIFKMQNQDLPLGLWIQSFSSLSPETLNAEHKGRTIWNPATPGVEFKPVPGTARPADSPAQRTRQLRAIARDFHASDNFRKKGWLDLRLLPTPIARYGRTGTSVLDGALFAFAEGTDPEVFLLVEARSGSQGIEWQYALAPMTVFAVRASYQGKTIWELPDRKPSKDPVRTYFDYIDKSIRP